MHYAASEGRANIMYFMIDNGYRIDATLRLCTLLLQAVIWQQ